MTIIQPTKQNIQKVSRELLCGEVVSIPTETVYGLAADSTNADAIKKIYRIKNRPEINPLIAHFFSLEQIEQQVEINTTVEKLAAKFWPGPLTIVLKKKTNCQIDNLATAGLATVAVRIPVHPVTLKLLELVEIPLVAPSANPSGRLSCVTAEQVQKLLGNKINWVLDGGQCQIGLESTVIDLSEGQPSLLRYGAISVYQLENICGKILLPEKNQSIKSPGMLLKHYAPKCPIRLSFDNPRVNEALIAFGCSIPDLPFARIVNLSEKGDLEEAASRLFSVLHDLEESGVDSIAVMPIPEEGIGKAINDRLSRAAANFLPDSL